MARSFGFYVTRFALAHIGIVVALMALGYVLTYVDTLTLPEGAGIGAAIGILTVVLCVPSIQTGKVFFDHTNRAMTVGEGWGFALVFTIVVLVLYDGIFYGVSLFEPQLRSTLSEAVNYPATVAIILGCVALFFLLTHKLVLSATIRGQIKRANRRESRR